MCLEPNVAKLVLHLTQVFHQLLCPMFEHLIVAALRQGLQLSSSPLPSFPSELMELQNSQC